MNNRIKVAKLIFSLGAVLGILSAGGGVLYGAALGPRSAMWTTFLATFVPVAVLWSLFCYLAYKGLTSERAVLKFVFWTFVVFNLFVFPIGTGISGVSIWLWRDLRKQNIRPVSA